MGTVLNFAERNSGRSVAQEISLTPLEAGMLLGLIRAVSCAVNRPRDAYYAEIIARENIEDIRQLPRARLAELVIYLTAILIANTRQV